MMDDDDLDALRDRLITARQGHLARFTSLSVRTVTPRWLSVSSRAKASISSSWAKRVR